MRKILTRHPSKVFVEVYPDPSPSEKRTGVKGGSDSNERIHNQVVSFGVDLHLA
jgi:hypothetical protein